MENQLKIGTKDEEIRLQVSGLMRRLPELTKKEAAGVNKNIVAFVGPTKGGKSTLINCLLGTQLLCKMNEYTEETFIEKADDESGPKIGRRGESETENPECCGYMPRSNCSMWDFPGFGDNKGTEQEIVNAISYQKILLAAESVCFVLVVPCDMIKDDNILPFYEILNELHNICPEIADSLCIVFTKFDKGNITKLLEYAKSKEFPNTNKTNKDIINQGKIILEKILDTKSYMDFKYPKMEEGEEDKIFILPNKQQFIDCISKLRGTKVKVFPLVISDKAKLEIGNFYTVFYHKVKFEVKEMNTLIEKYIQNKINEIKEAKQEDGKPTSEESRLAYFKKGKSTMEEIIEKSKDFKTFFGEIEKLGLESKTFSENIEKFVFTEKLKNMYKIKDSNISLQGELELFLNVKIALKSGAKQFSDYIVASTKNIEREKEKEKEWEKQYNDEIKFLREESKKLEEKNKFGLSKIPRIVINKLISIFTYPFFKYTPYEGQTVTEPKDLADPNKKEKIKILEEVRKTYNYHNETDKKNYCQISLVKYINYNNPLLNKPLLLKSFSDLYGTKALSYLISLTEVLSEDSSESLQEICGSPHALEMFATMIGLS